MINLDQKSYYSYGYDFIPLHEQQSNFLTKDYSRDYIGTVQGFVGVNSKRAKHYDELVLNILNQNEVYQNILQSLFMNIYFVVTNFRAIVLNIHTHEIISNKLFAGFNQNITSFTVIQQLLGAVCLRQSSMQVVYFGGKLLVVKKLLPQSCQCQSQQIFNQILFFSDKNKHRFIFIWTNDTENILMFIESLLFPNFSK
ncbi:hypothetical protein ABPG72_006527 [Tetrahymena utriculariae]